MEKASGLNLQNFCKIRLLIFVYVYRINICPEYVEKMGFFKDEKLIYFLYFDYALYKAFHNSPQKLLRLYSTLKHDQLPFLS